MTIGVAVGQFIPSDDTERNLHEIRVQARVAAERGAQLVVLPEYSSYFTPQTGRNWVEAGQRLDGKFATTLAEIGNSCGVFMVAGMLETVAGGRVSNTVIATSPEDGVVATYRKQHLYDAFGHSESEWVQPGILAAPQTFTVHGVYVGLQTCYDLRFPEVTRQLIDAGAELVCVPAAWTPGPLKTHHWRTLLAARAIENIIYLAAADHAPPSGIGDSAIFDPMGVQLAGIGEAAGVANAWISRERVAAIRRINPALELRRYRVIPG